MFQEEAGQGCEWAFVYLAYVVFYSVHTVHTYLGLYRMSISTRLSQLFLFHTLQRSKNKKELG